MINKHIKITEEQYQASKKEEKKTGNTLSSRIRELLQKHYKKEGFL